MRIFARANYPFISKRRLAYFFSGTLLILGIAAITINSLRAAGWVNYGVDFTGGVLIQVRFDQAMTVEEVRSALRMTPVSEVSRFREAPEFIVRAPAPREGEIEKVADDIIAALSSNLEARRFEVVRSELVGPKVGGELERKAAMAIGLSFLLTLIYLAFRFEARFGLAAIIATAHDILITLGFLSLLRLEVNISTVAAILTVIGYSLNDTIVVFDRIRENLRKKRHSHAEEMEIVNRSINETLPRTVLTSGTTVAVLVPLFLLGGAVLRDFALVLIIGIVFGTYSSIFVASPALLEIRSWSRGRRRAFRTPQAAASSTTPGAGTPRKTAA